MWELRHEVNRYVTGRVRQQEYAEDLWKICQEDVDIGAMTEPECVTHGVPQDALYSRRIIVRELRAKGWRSRAVDHVTESLFNQACLPRDKAVIVAEALSARSRDDAARQAAVFSDSEAQAPAPAATRRLVKAVRRAGKPLPTDAAAWAALTSETELL